jgi:hypothetical protein
MYPTRDYRKSVIEEPPDSPAGDSDANEMNRLRSIAIVQAAETEAVLGKILSSLDPSVKSARPAGVLLRVLRQRLDTQTSDQWADDLNYIGTAIERRNMLVHNTVSIDYVWVEYGTGDGGDHIPVLSRLGYEMYDEEDLRKDIELQRDGTLRAVKLLHHVTHGRGASPEAGDCVICQRAREHT